MCYSKQSALSYLTTESSEWTSGTQKTKCETAIGILNDGDKTSQYSDAINDLNDVYWDCTEISDRICFGQAVFAVSYSTDPVRPFPKGRPTA